jgi:hypothetical protein
LLSLIKPAFYFMPTLRTRLASLAARTTLLLAIPLGISACGDAAPEVIERDDSQFQIGSVLAPYEPIPEGGMDDRLIGKLRLGSKEALRFAKEEIGKRGDAILPRLLEEMQIELDGGSTSATNFLSALVYTRTKQQLPILAEILASHPLPLVRSQALDTIARLQQTELEQAVLEHAKVEGEAGPASRIIPCLAMLGGDAAVDYLAAIVRTWSGGERQEPRGTAAWDNLLTIDSPAARRAIAFLVDGMPPLQRSAGITRLIHLGDLDLAEEVRSYLDPEVFPAAGVRHKAVEGLAVAGDFEGVLLAQDDPDLRVRLAVVDAMRIPEAAAQDLGRNFLEAAARDEDEDMARAALQALVERGDSSFIEPWLQLVKGYPTQPRSIGATRMFLHAKLEHPALVSLLIQRWPYCDSDQRIDLGRVLAAHPSAEGIDFLASVVVDEKADPDVRLYSITSLGNSGPQAIDSLLKIWAEKPSPVASERLLNALLRFPDEPRVRDFLVELATVPGSPDFARAQVLSALPKAYGLEAYAMLMQARKSAERDVVRRYIEELLHEYF